METIAITIAAVSAIMTANATATVATKNAVANTINTIDVRNYKENIINVRKAV